MTAENRSFCLDVLGLWWLPPVPEAFWLWTAPSGVSVIPSPRGGRHGVWCDRAAIGEVNQKGRPRHGMGVMTRTTRADRETLIMLPR